MDALSVLRGARALIATPDKWTQGAYARDAEGGERLPMDDHAVCWCAFGAISRVSENDWSNPTDYQAIHFEFSRFVGDSSLVYWNDLAGRTHAEVLDAFDAVIAKLEVANVDLCAKESG